MIEWKQTEPQPAPTQETHRLFVGSVSLHLWRHESDKPYYGMGQVDLGLIIGDYKTTAIGEAKRKAIHNLRERLANALADVDAFIADSCLAEAGIENKATDKVSPAA